MLHHFIYDLSRIGSVSYMMADLYKSSQKRFKDDYKMTSKQLYSVIREPLKHQDSRHRTTVSGIILINVCK